VVTSIRYVPAETHAGVAAAWVAAVAAVAAAAAIGETLADAAAVDDCSIGRATADSTVDSGQCPLARQETTQRLDDLTTDTGST
jgi:hypothetical protein